MQPCFFQGLCVFCILDLLFKQNAMSKVNSNKNPTYIKPLNAKFMLQMFSTNL